MNSRVCILTGSICMALAVGFGAFGAHIVQEMLTADRFMVYQTAVEYHFYHAIGLIITGMLMKLFEENRWFAYGGYGLLAGILIFSGSLYLLTLTDTGWLGAITPIGGTAFIAGWVCIAIGIVKATQTDGSG